MSPNNLIGLLAPSFYDYFLQIEWRGKLGGPGDGGE
jgi:hypothetical protein